MKPKATDFNLQGALNPGWFVSDSSEDDDDDVDADDSSEEMKT